MFSTQNAKSDGGFKPGKFINIGAGELKIVKLEAQKSRAGDKFKVVCHLESSPITEDGFEGHEGALGRIGRVDLSIYTTGTDQYKDQFLDRFATISETMGVRDQLDKVSGATIDEYLTNVTKIIGNKPIWWLIGGEEYMGKNKEGAETVKFFLRLPKFSYVAESEEALLKKMKDGVYPDRTVAWFFKPLEVMDADALTEELNKSQDEKDLLPF